MKEGWKMNTLSEVCIINPKKNEVKSKLDDKDFVSFLPMNDLGIMDKNICPKQQKELGEVYKGYTYFAEKDVLLAKVTPCFENGKLGIANHLTNGFGFGSSEYIVLRSLGDLLPEYLFYFLSTEQFREDGAKLMFGACGLKRLSKDYVDNTLIKYPPLPEQQRIVEILDDAFAKIDTVKQNAECNRDNAKELFQSVLNFEMQPKKSWEEKTLGNVCIKITDGSHNPPKGIEYSEYIMLSSKNIVGGEITFDNPRYLKKEDYDIENKRTYLSENDILLTIVGTIGRTAIVPNWKHKVTLQRSVAVLKPNSNLIYPKYLQYLLDSIILKLEKESRGVAQKGIYLTQLKDISISLPETLEEQQQIVSKLDALSARCKELENNYQQTINDCDEFKKAILAKAFNGEL